MKTTNESENLADRLRALYQTYNCEHELPEHQDLVAKLESAGSEVRDSFQVELGKGEVDPICYEEAKLPLSKKIMLLYATAMLGGIKSLPLALKVMFSRETTTRAMESYNHLARAVFQEFKEEVRYELDEEFRKKVDAGLYDGEL